MRHWIRLSLLMSGLLSFDVWAMADGKFYLGVGYFSESSFGKQTQSESGAGSTFGSITYPLLLKYDWAIGASTFFTPTLTYTVLDRESAGGSAKVNLWHLILPFGQNYTDEQFDWYVGLGVLNRTIKGKGGTETLNNGSGFATFARPGRSVASRTLTFNAGSAFNYGASRFAFDFILEGLATEKRNFNFMLSYAYSFSFGGY